MTVKVYLCDSRAMPEVSSESVQIVIISTTEVCFLNPNGQPILGLTQEYVDNITKLMPETDIFMHAPFDVWSCYKQLINECIRALKPNGYLVLNVGTPHGNSDLYRIARYFRGLTTLFPYVAADIYLENTDFHLVHDLIVSYSGDDRDVAPSLTVENYAEHFFIFSKQRKQHLTLKSVLTTTSLRKSVSEKPFTCCFHPDVISYLIEQLSSKGDVVLDPMAGSCVTGAVAEKLGRNSILYDIETTLKPLMKETLAGCEVEWCTGLKRVVVVKDSIMGLGLDHKEAEETSPKQ
jgi:hypothetical protein